LRAPATNITDRGIGAAARPWAAANIAPTSPTTFSSPSPGSGSTSRGT